MTTLQAEYDAVHDEAKALWGPASALGCVVCWSNAQGWAYQHTAAIRGEEKRLPNGAPFSTDPEDYAPMCWRHHVALDNMFDLKKASRGGKVSRGFKLETLQENNRALSERYQNDAGFIAKRSAQNSGAAKVRVTCEVCGYESNGGNVARHQRSVRHGRFYQED